MRYFSKPVIIGALLFLWLITKTVMAAEGGSPPPSQALAVSPESLWVLGFLFGYFLIYTVRHGSKTQDVFKGFLGITGAVGGAGWTLLLSEQAKTAGLVAYAWGTVYGFLAYVAIAFILAIIYSGKYSYTPNQPATGAALFAEILGKVLLGEDLRPPPSK